MALQKADIGCRPEAQYMHDDGGFLRAFATVPTWQTRHRAVARCVATAERQFGAPPSQPQPASALHELARPVVQFEPQVHWLA